MMLRAMYVSYRYGTDDGRKVKQGKAAEEVALKKTQRTAAAAAASKLPMGRYLRQKRLTTASFPYLSQQG